MNRTKGKNILCIYYQFPPIKGIGTLRNAKFYSSLKQEARKVYVLTTTNKNFLPSDDYEIEIDNEIALPTMDFRTIHHKMFGSKGSLLPYKKTSRFSSLVVDLLHIIPFYSIFGEGGMRFVRNGIKQGRKLIKEEGIDMIFSSFRPSATHLIARALKKEFPHITWIADYRDVTPDPMRSHPRSFKFIIAAHKRILKYADEVLTVSDGLKENLSRYHKNVSVIRNGFERSLLNNGEGARSKFFTFTYTGIIYRKTQRADMLFRALRSLIDEQKIDEREIQFAHAGKDPDYWREVATEYQLSGIFVNKGLIPHNEAIELQRASNINVLLTWSSKDLQGIVTGKVYEYLAARKPIFTLINGIRDKEIEQIIESSGAGKVFYNRAEELENIKSFLHREYLKWKAGESSVNSTSSILPYSWDHQFKQWNIPLKVVRGNKAVGGE